MLFNLRVIATFSGKTSEPSCGKTTKNQVNFFYKTQSGLTPTISFPLRLDSPKSGINVHKLDSLQDSSIQFVQVSYYVRVCYKIVAS